MDEDVHATLLGLGDELFVLVGHLRLEAGDDRRVHLADARFGEIERGADFLHRHFFVVVQDEDEPLGAGEALGDEALEVATLDFVGGVGGAAVFEDVDFADVLVAVGFEPLAGRARPG